ncbi:MAG TPA: aromatic ring-hydroxylating dioxygenase subunit alpha [Candidatus Methylomirabilis sp.]|nr:aromatic ring-hydroxylating dioxygenase subunit alpha [Candidatus Methylomirabilis sp.]
MATREEELHRVVNSGKPSEPDPRAEIPVLGFQDYWYPLISAANVPRRKPLTMKLLGEELCVFRGDSGVAVVSNFCPHRGTRLGAGLCHYQGTVSCPYHGWTFDERGECVAVLSEGPASTIPGRVSVRRYPTRTLKGIVFVWMGESAPVAPEKDLPPELFDESLLLHDATVWKANWRPALENFQDNHAPYIHRNSIRLLMRPFLKISYTGAKPIITGGGVRLSHYSDGTAGKRPYREYFPGVKGYWPKHRWRLLWAWAFRTPLLRWLSPQGALGKHPAPYHADPEWNNGPHMPGIQRILQADWHGSFLYTRWCVPIDECTTREFYFHAVRPHSALARFLEIAKFPLVSKFLYYRNFGYQDGRVLEDTPYDRPERFSSFDVETIGWRRLAVLSARYGGRHDRIPAEVIERLNGTPAPARTAPTSGAGASSY